MSTIQDSDQFLVQRDSDSFKQSAVNLMSTILDTDYMLVQRGDDSFKVSCLDVKDQLGGGGSAPPVLESVTLVQNAPIDANRFTGKLFTSTVSNAGQAATVLDMTATVTGVLGIKAGSATIETNNYDGGSAVALNLQSDVNLGTVVEVGDTVTASASYTPQTSEIVSVASSGVGTTYETMGSSDANANWNQGSAVQYNVGQAPASGSAATILVKAFSGAVFGIAGNFTNSTKNIAISVSDDGTNWTGLGDYSQLDLNVSQGNGFVMEKPYLRVAFGVGAGTEYWYVREAKDYHTLTFADSTDLKYFQAGDVVGSSDGITYEAVTDGNITIAFDPFKNPQAIANGFLSSSPGGIATSVTFTFPSPSDFSSVTKMGGGGYANSTSFTLEFWDENNTRQESIEQTGSVWTPTDLNTAPPALVSKLRITCPESAGGFALTGFFNSSGVGVVTGELSTDIPAKVISTDVTNSTMTVDGGKWAAVNDSQVWSNGADKSNPTYPITNGFDGDETTIARSSAGDPILITFNPAVPINSTLDIWANHVGSNDGHLIINGTSVANSLSSTSSAIAKDTFTQFTELSTLQIGSNGTGSEYVGFSKIAIDGKALIDAVNDSQDWTATGTWVNPLNDAYKDSLFDGDLTTGWAAASGTTATYTFATPQTFATSVRLYAGTSTSVDPKFNVNGVLLPNPPAPGAGKEWVDITSHCQANGNNLASIQVSYSAGNYSTSVCGVEIDGKLLVDKGVRNLGETSVSTSAPKQGSGTLSAINGTQVTIEPFTDNCFVEGQFLTVDKTIDVSPVTDPIASYDDATKTLTFTDSKDLIQFVDGDEVYMADADGNAVSPTFTTSAITTVAPANYAEGGTITGAIHPSSGKTLDTIFNGIVSKTFGVNNGVCTGSNANNVLTFGSPIVLTEDDELKAAMFKNGDGGQIVDMRFDDGSTLRFQATDLPSISVSGTVEENLTTIDHQGRNLVGMNYYGSDSNVTTVNGFYLNGSLLIDGQTTVLTFADSTNFDKFQVGDDVGDPGGTSNVSYTGNGSSQAITGVGFSPDFVWLKSRTQGSASHGLFDSIRGATERLISDSTGTESTQPNTLQSFDADGFTIGTDAAYNGSGSGYVAWCWDAGDGSPVTNTDGSISTTVKANASTGFSVVTWNGTGSEATIGHGLGQIPSFIITKNLNQSSGWKIYHDGGRKTGGSTAFSPYYWYTFTTAIGSGAANQGFTNTRPTANVFSFAAAANQNSQVAYCWAETPGMSKFGSHTNSASGTQTVELGFQPAWLMIKRTTSASAYTGWLIWSEATGFDYTGVLYANESYSAGKRGNGTDAGNYLSITVTPTGFTFDLGAAEFSQPNEPFIYVAFSGDAVASIVDIDEAVSKMTMDADIKSVGDTLSVTKSGTGTVDSVNVAAKSMILSASNDQWVNGFRAATATKPAVATTAYLQFDQTGAVSGYSPVPVPVRAMDNLITPQLTFPAEFSDTGTAPDAEFADANAYLEVSVTLKNQNGASGPKSSNAVVPSTNQRSISAGEVTNNAESVGRMIEQVVTHEQRVADNYADEMKKKATQLEAALAKYSSDESASYSATSTRRRARNADGTFRADDPSTPDINEAWEDGEA